MKYLIIYAHPHHEGHNGYFLKNLENALQTDKKDYKILDLYQLNFNPVFTARELTKTKDQESSPEILDYQTKIQATDRLIFIYPTWWQAPPAILKGFIDRVFTSGFAYQYKNGMPVGLLKNKKAAVFTTTGAPKIFSQIFTGSTSLKLVSKYSLSFCGIKSRGFQVGSSRNLEKNKPELVKVANKIISYLES